MSIKNILAAGALSVGLLGGGVAIANAATTTNASTAVVASSSASTNASSAAAGQGSQAGGHMGDRGANPNDKTITGTNADKATAAVVAANPGFKVNLVQQDPDGSYDVHGTLSDGTATMFNVTTDFQVSTNNQLGMVGSPNGSNASGAASSASSTSTNSSSAAASAAS